MKLVGIIVGTILLLGMVLVGTGCVPILGNASEGSPTPSTTQVPYSLIEKLIKSSSTYRFDGIDGTLKIVRSTGLSDGSFDFVAEYQTRQPGHGGRSGQMLAQVITNHTAVVLVKDGKVISALCDNEWDLLTDKGVTTSSPQVPLGEEFVLPVGQSVTLTGENLIIKFVGVTGDSRSPIGAQTIWAGEAKIQLEVTDQGSVSNVTLTEKGLTDGYTQDSFKQYAISFKLEPYPEVDKQPAAGDYRLVMKVTSGENQPK